VISERFPAASIFLLVAGIAFLFAFAIPILFFPIRWARLFKWNVGAETPLTIYFARSLGAVAVAIVATCLLAVPHPEDYRGLFDLLTIAGALLAAVHVWGALERSQPWTETAEIALYAGLTVLAFVVKP
jgi:hypothetical protein